MPKLKGLYGKYKDQGVEFIGVSLDSPGEGARQAEEVCRGGKRNRMAAILSRQWFGTANSRRSWGESIFIPSLFVVDAEGNLHSTAGRANLDAMILELIKKRDQKT